MIFHRLQIAALSAVAVLLIPVLAIAEVKNPGFEKVTSKLDSGGTFYLYTDLGSAVDKAIAPFEPLMLQSSSSAAVPGILKATARSLGLSSVHDLGMSVISLDEKSCRAKLYMLVPKDEGLFKLRGKEPVDLQGIKYIPEDAVAMTAQSANLAQILPIIREAAGNIAGAAGQGKVDQILAQMKNNGVDMEKVSASLGKEWGAYVRLDSAKPVEIKDVTFPRPGFVIMIQTTDSIIYDTICALASKSGKPLQAKEQDGAKSIELPFDAYPFGLKPVAAQLDGWFMLASSMDELQIALATPRSGKDIRTSKDFISLSNGLPSKVSGVSFISPRLGKETAAILKKSPSFSTGRGRAGIDMLQTILRASDDSPGRLTVRIDEPEGILWISQGDTGALDPLQVFSGSPVVLPIMAAIAIPNFLEARERSQVSRARADMRSLATGIESYFVDNNAYPASSTDGFRKTLPGEKKVSSFASPALTTPIGYLTNLLPDPFVTEGRTYGYYSDKAGWILFSPGPDGKFDLDWKIYDSSVPQPSPDLLKYVYDPTNGTISSGDIIRVKQ